MYELFKFLFIVGLLATVAAFASIIITPQSGYEISIYTSSLSPITWVLIISGIMIGIILVVSRILLMKSALSWSLGALLIMANMTIVLLLPVLRGYYLYGRSDFATHTGFVQDILAFGGLPKYTEPASLDMYPLFHVLVASVSLVTGAEPTTIMNCVFAFFWILYMIFMYLLASMIFQEKRKSALVMILSSVLLVPSLDFQVLPYTFFLLLSPLLLFSYLYLRRERTRGACFMFLLLIAGAFPLIHPLPMFFFIATISLIELSNRLRPRLLLRRKIAITVPLISFIVLIEWLFTNGSYYLNIGIKSLFSRIVNSPSATKSTSAILEQIFGSIGLSFQEIIELFLKIYGVQLVYAALTLLVCLFVMTRFSINRKRNERLVIICEYALISFVIFLANLFFPILQVGFSRYLNIFILITPLLVGHLLFEGFRRFNSKLAAVFITSLLLVATVSSVACYYPSPYIKRPNHPVSQSEVTGIIWFVQNKNPTYEIDNLRYNIRVVAMAIFGFGETDVTIWPKNLVSFVPDHFDYSNRTGLSHAYMLISAYDKAFYVNVYPELKEFNTKDFEEIANHTILDKLYSNGGLDVFLVGR